ncbi:MAG: AraC family transcriptional regulator [Celeribacter sp.]|jgi:AraC family transcriptional regulator
MAQGYEARLLRVLDYVYANLDGDLSLDTLADVAALSRFHFHRVFTGMTGETVAAFTRRVRLFRASIALVQTNDPVDQISTYCGYSNARSFVRAFGDAYGLTPEAFRRQGVPHPALHLNEHGDYEMYDVNIETRADTKLAVVAHRGDYMNVGEAFETAFTTLTARGFGPQIGQMIGLYWDDPAAVPLDDLRSFAGAEILGDAEIAAPLEQMDIKGGAFAVLKYQGHYSGLAKAYAYLFGEWVPKSGKDLRDSPPFEVYLNTPQDTAAEDLITLICAPLK